MKKTAVGRHEHGSNLPTPVFFILNSEFGSSLFLWPTKRYCNSSGGSPFIIFPNFLAPNPFENVRIIFFI